MMTPFILTASLGNVIGIIPDVPLFPKQIQNFCQALNVDQLMVLSNPLRIHNQDATIALACGNGTRCVAALGFGYIQGSIPPHLCAFLEPFFSFFRHHVHYPTSPSSESTLILPGPIGPLETWCISPDEQSERFPMVSMFSKSGLLVEHKGAFSHNFEVAVHQSPCIFSQLKETPYPCPLILPHSSTELGIPGWVVDMGNPHLIFLRSPEDPSWDFAEQQSQNPLFSEMNFSFLHPARQPMAPMGLKESRKAFLPEMPSFSKKLSWTLTTYERGVGWTLGCGSGLCAGAEVLFQFHQNPAWKNFVDLAIDPCLPFPSFSKSCKILCPGGSVQLRKTPDGWIHQAAIAPMHMGFWHFS